MNCHFKNPPTSLYIIADGFLGIMLILVLEIVKVNSRGEKLENFEVFIEERRKLILQKFAPLIVKSVIT